MLGIGLGLTTLAAQGGWSPAALFSAGQAGFWGDYTPASGLIWQDSAGLTPATAFDQPVGRSNRRAGTVDGAQATALSRPVLARWPRGGRRNALRYTDQLTNGVWTVQANATLAAQDGAWRIGNTGGNPRFVSQSGIPFPGDGPSTVSVDIKGLDSMSGSIELVSNQGASGGRFGLTLDTGAVTIQPIGTAGATAAVVSVSEPDADGYRRYALTASPGSTGNVARSLLISCNGLVGTGILVRRPQVEAGMVATPYQLVTTANDVIEAGKPDLWHLWNDGGDSLPTTAALPAGTYGVAYFNLDTQQAVIGTLTSDGTTPVDTLRATRQAFPIIRAGAFTAGEIANLNAYYAGIAA